MAIIELPEPVTAAGREGLAALLADPGGAVAAFDFDGTLAPIVPDPAAARAHPRAAAALTALAPLVGSLVVVTGRPAALAVEYGDLARVPGLVVLGQYGVERWDAGSGEVRAPAPHPGVAQVRELLPGRLESLGAGAGTWVEDKGRALAVHTRRADAPEEVLELLREPMAALAAEHGLMVEPGRLVLELRPPGVDKGAALSAFLRERAARGVLYAGDDLGDLAAFAAVEKGRTEGVPGLLVCSGAVGDAPVRALADRADLVVPGPAGVVALLEALVERLSAGRPGGPGVSPAR
ncbi:trehalose-phosphatase [Kitasatospora sp. NBC_00240]|uniref:trehalose-phosphatase n=1 Tax=Kitasatospora sp. NBC_00240 TaxID=2903567 RepID=UPI00225A3834|nr:trehalose-phosphatase [Kitasatospora sp. NBC_00240]MCX5211321.1 trehalose-phosphatase [Kitasatospora sp. NBC_00240]